VEERKTVIEESMLNDNLTMIGDQTDDCGEDKDEVVSNMDFLLTARAAAPSSFAVSYDVARRSSFGLMN
jgi:hypothetical protein